MKSFLFFFVCLSSILIFNANSVYSQIQEQWRQQIIEEGRVWIVNAVISPTSIELKSPGGTQTIVAHLQGLMITDNPDVNTECMNEIMRLIYHDSVIFYIDENAPLNSQAQPAGFIYYANCNFCLNSTLIYRGLVLMDETVRHFLFMEFINLQNMAYQNHFGIWDSNFSRSNTDLSLYNIFTGENYPVGSQNFSVSDDASYEQIASIQLPQVYSFMTFDNRIFALCGSNGIAIIDVQEPSNPQIIRSIDCNADPILIREIYFPESSSHYACIVFNNPQGIGILNLDDYTLGQTVNLADKVNPDSVISLAGSSNVICISDGSNIVHRIDISDPSNPLYSDSFEIEEPGRIIYDTALGNYFFIRHSSQSQDNIVTRFFDCYEIDIAGMIIQAGQSVLYGESLLIDEDRFCVLQGNSTIAVYEISSLPSFEIIESIEIVPDVSEIIAIHDNLLYGINNEGSIVIFGQSLSETIIPATIITNEFHQIDSMLNSGYFSVSDGLIYLLIDNSINIYENTITNID